MLYKRKVFTLPLQEKNSCAPETFLPNAHPQQLRTEAKISKIGWIPLEIYGFCRHSVQVESGKFQMFYMRKFSPCHCKSKISVRLKLSTKMSTLTIFELRQRFRKSVEYLWRYRIFAGTVYRLKVGYFKCCTCAKFSPCHCKSTTSAHLKFSTRMPTVNIFELKQRLRKSVE